MKAGDRGNQGRHIEEVELELCVEEKNRKARKCFLVTF